MKKNSAFAFLMFGIAVLSYVFAFVNRSSFAALGTVAQEHFGVEATIVSVFVMVQLILYAGMQIPVGIYLDRAGASVVLSTGLAMMGLGQLIMGLAPNIAFAIVARVLVGAGDACMFISLVRVTADWFLPKYIPTLNQISGLLGQGGQLLAVAPLAALVAGIGWSAAFEVIFIVSLVLLALVALVLHDTPASNTLVQRLFHKKKPVTNQPTLENHKLMEEAFPLTSALPVTGPGSSGIIPALKGIMKRPGVRLGFWIHFTTQFSTNTFVLLWGLPFLTGGLGYDDSTAHTLVNLVIIVVMMSGLIAGPIFSRFEHRRIVITLAIDILLMLSWLVVLLWPGQTPVWVMTICIFFIGIAAPTAMVAFDVIRSHTPVTQRGIATGFANMGGFTAALTAVLLIGVVLDVLGAGTPETYTMTAFKWAMGVQIPIFLLGLTMLFIEYPKAHRYLQSKGIR